MSHSAVNEAGWSCTRCHAMVGHGEATARQTGYTMDMCLGCHSTNPGNQATCEVCHVGGMVDARPRDSRTSTDDRGFVTTWEVTHGPRSREIHGMGDLSTCKACHILQYCVSCHGIELPHPSGHLATHGQALVDEVTQETTCLTCHEQAACVNCHQIDMPHPVAFLSEHDDAARERGEALCSRCHDPSTCDACHIRHVHPGIPQDHLKQLRERPIG